MQQKFEVSRHAVGCKQTKEEKKGNSEEYPKLENDNVH